MNIGPEIYFSIIIGVFWILIFNWFSRKKTKSNFIDLNQTKVSVLLSVRNEEYTIIRCLEALSKLNYNLQNIEILIGDDASEDNTFSLVESFIINKPQFKLFQIKKQLGLARGKANVLAHLAHQAQGEYFFITDADIEVQPNWINAMLSHVCENTGIVTGYTHVVENKVLAQLQTIDWTLTQGMMKVFFDSDKPLTTMGNNMLISRVAYFKTGGYENLPFSVTEDYALFEKVVALNYECVQAVDAEVKVYSLPMNTFKEVLQQRKRWFIGVYDKLPWYLLAMIVMQLMYFPMAFYISTKSLKFTLVALLLKWIVQSLFLILVFRSVKEKINIVSLLLFDFYSAYVSWYTVISLIFSRKVMWKGREY